MKKKRVHEIPTAQQLEAELRRIRYQKRYRSVLCSTVCTLIVVAAISVLVSTLWLPVLRIFGKSMTPLLKEGEIVVAVKASDYKCGDIVAFYYNNKILVKRIIGGPGDVIDIDKHGTVSVNEERLDEPYLTEKALGKCNIDLPFQVPDGRFFVMGDHRSASVDSRNTALGCVSSEQMAGKVIFRIWPLKQMGILN